MNLTLDQLKAKATAAEITLIETVEKHIKQEVKLQLLDKILKYMASKPYYHNYDAGIDNGKQWVAYLKELNKHIEQ